MYKQTLNKVSVQEIFVNNKFHCIYIGIRWQTTHRHTSSQKKIKKTWFHFHRKLWKHNNELPVIMVTFIWPHIYWPSKIIYSFEDFDGLTDLWSSLVMIFHYTTHSKIFTSQILSIHHSQKHSREIMRFVSGGALEWTRDL